MKSKAYTVLGWAVWQLARRQLAANRSKLIAAGAVAAVVAIGIALASSSSDDE